MTYLITGATGKVGTRVAREMLRRGLGPRLLVRDIERARALYGPEADCRAADLADVDSLPAVLAGVEAVVLINTGPFLGIRDALFARAARQAGVRSLIKLSALSAEERIAVGAWHADGEDAIRDSGLGFTFVRAAGFMSNALEWRRSIVAEDVVRACTGDGRAAYIHPEDIAAVLVEALVTDRYSGQTLPITGPRALTYAEMVERIAAVIGRPLRFEPIGDEETLRRLRAAGLPPEEAAALVDLWRALRAGRLATVTDVVQQVLGREAHSFDRWARENAAAFS